MSYQTKAMAFAKYTDHDYPFLALGEESGEVLGKLAKYVRKNQCNLNDALIAAISPANLKEQTLRENLVNELGDVMWQLTACCEELGISLEELQERNLAKLEGREVRNTIVGEGDNR